MSVRAEGMPPLLAAEAAGGYLSTLCMSKTKPVWVYNLEVALLSAIATMAVLLLIATTLALGT